MSSLTLAQAIWPPRPESRTAAWGRDALLVVAFSLLTAASAWVSIPLPFTKVPITGQTFAVLLTGALLGPRLGAAAMLLYLAEGSAGLPFFHAGAAGVGVIAGPTGGYLLSYPFAAFLTGWLAERGWDRRPATMLLAMLLGSLVIFTCGTLQLSLFPPLRIGAPFRLHMGWEEAVVEGFLPFIPGDALKALLAAGLLPAGWKLLGKRGQ